MVNNRFPKPNSITPSYQKDMLGEDVDFILNSELSISQLTKNPHVKLFCANYLQSRDVKQASLETGISYSEGQRIYNNKHVQRAISKITDTLYIKHNIDPSSLVKKVQEVAEVDMIEFQNPDGSYKNNLKDVSPETRRAVKSFTVKNLYGEDMNGMQTVVGQMIKVEFWDKLKAVEMVGREVSLFKETKKIEHDVTSNMAEVLLQSRERAEEEARKHRESKALAMNNRDAVIDVTPKKAIVGSVMPLPSNEVKRE